MKKILISLILIASLFSVKAQTLFPTTQTRGNATQNNTLFRDYGGYTATVGIILPIYSDTTSASANLYAKWYDGLMMKTVTPNATWWRDLLNKRWIQNTPAAGPGGIIDWTIGGNETWFGSSTSNEALGWKAGVTKGIDLTTNGVTRVALASTGLGLLSVVADTTANKVMTFNPSTKAWGYSYWFGSGGGGSGLTSVGLTMPSAFTVTNSPLVANGTLAVTGSGTTAQYIRGDGSLATYTGGQTWQQTLTNGSTLTGNNNIGGGGFGFTWTNLSQLSLNGGGAGIPVGYFTNTTSANALAVAGTSTSSVLDVFQVLGGAGAATTLFTVRANGTLFAPLVANTTTQDRLLGQINATGQIGNITLGSGLSLSSGVLNTSGTVATPISSLTAATATNNINNGSKVQSWGWETLGESGGNTEGLLLYSNSTTVDVGNSAIILSAQSAGANSNSGITSISGQFTNVKTGTSSVNVGIDVEARSGATNIAAQFRRGSVNLGTVGTESGVINWNGSISGTVKMQSAAAAGTWTMTLPTTDGGANEFLQTDGNGVTSWAASGACATCVTAASALTANQLMIGAGSQASAVTTTGTGVLTALGVAVGSAGAFVVNGGALGTPSSGTVTNLTGTASININGTVGATTPAAGAFTTLTSTSAGGNGLHLIIPGLAHGITNKAPTDVAAFYDTYDANGGVYSLAIRKIIDAPTLIFDAVLANVTASATVPVVGFYAAKKSGTGTQALAAGEMAMQFVNNYGGTALMSIMGSGNVGLGTVAPSARLHLISTTEQERSGYDVSNYYSTTVSSAGAVTFNAVGASSAFVFSDAITINGNLTLGTAGNALLITEGSNGRVGQTALTLGTVAVTITGLTTSSRAFITLVSPSGVTLTTQYQAVCTSNTLTIQANVAAGTINTADGSTLNYFVIN